MASFKACAIKDVRTADCDEHLILSTVELMPNRLYFMSLNTLIKPKYTANTHFFSIDEELTYDAFYEDFGPLNLAQLYKYCMKVQAKLKSPFFESRKIIHFTNYEPQNQINSAFLVGAYAILFLKMSAQQIYNELSKDINFTEFRDASTGVPVYTLSLLDCLLAVEKAKECRFFDPEDFQRSEYTHYETVEHGDLNWIIPNKFLAFAGPHSHGYRINAKSGRSQGAHTPKFYHKFFKASNVSTIVRLNNRCYDAKEFTDFGFEHVDIIYPDGGTPPDHLVELFLRTAENARGAVAVHCKAGLGRTGSMIAIYIMKWYHFTSREAIAWLRICRPASVIGPQQDWLDSKQKEMWKAGKGLKRPIHQFGIYSYHRHKDHTDAIRGLASKVTTLNINTLIPDVNKNVCDDKQGELTQGDHLQNIKLGRLTPHKAANKINRSLRQLVGSSQRKKRKSSLERMSDAACKSKKARSSWQLVDRSRQKKRKPPLGRKSEAASLVHKTRLSWPGVESSQPIKKNVPSNLGTPPILARRSKSTTVKPSPLTKKKTISVIGTNSDDETMSPSAVIDNPAVPMRRSHRKNEQNRGSAALNLR